MQSQDYASGLWSLGVRMSDARVTDVQVAFERAEVLRTWPMRGTIHTIRASDAVWLLELTGVRALDASKRRREQLGLDLTVADRAADILVAALAESPLLTRNQSLAVLSNSGIDTAGQRGYHLLSYAALTGRICIGPTMEGQQTIASLADWAPRQTALSRPDAVTELVLRYFRSHGPATERDFVGWSGLTLGDTRIGLAANEGRIVPVECEGTTHWMSEEASSLLADGAFRSSAPTVVLSGFDEFILGFKDRSLQLPPEHFERIVPGGNGVFRATVCVDGQVVGTWNRRLLAESTAVDVEMLAPVSSAARSRITSAFEAYADFLGLTLRLTGLPSAGT